MASETEPTTFPELNRLLSEFVGRVRSIFGADLVGTYLTGSFALGAGDAASDCDFLVVTTEGPTAEQEGRLRALHDEILDWPGYWSYNLEGSYAPVADLRTLGALDTPWLYVNRGARELEWSTHCNTEDVRWVLRERAPTLTGRAPREFACEVPADLLRGKMRPQLQTFVEDLLSWTNFEISWTQRYAVEASTRMLFTLERGEVISKPAALEWATHELPAEWRPLIEQVAEDRFVTWNDRPRPGSVERALAYVEHVQQRARASALPTELKRR